jgi:hypothetical protein
MDVDVIEMRLHIGFTLIQVIPEYILNNIGEICI